MTRAFFFGLLTAAVAAPACALKLKMEAEQPEEKLKLKVVSNGSAGGPKLLVIGPGSGHRDWILHGGQTGTTEFVSELPLEIQQGFRRKLLTILLLQLLFTLAVGMCLRFVPEILGLRGDRHPIAIIFPPQSTQVHSSCLTLCGVGLPRHG